MTGVPLMPLDIFYRGERQYIQGSLIISRSAERLSATLSARQPIVMRDAKFSSIVNQSVDYAIADKQLPAGSGTIRFAADGQDHFVTIFPANRVIPPRQPDEPSRIVGVKESAPLCAEGRYCGLATFDDAISAVVEFNKALHARLPGM